MVRWGSSVQSRLPAQIGILHFVKIIFFDTETTGGGEKDRLVSLAVKERAVEAPIVNALYKPPMPIPIESMMIHHITDKMVAEKPSFTESEDYKKLKALFENSDTIGVAHNASFDIAMLAREGITPLNFICTYKVAAALDPEEKIGTYKLQYLRYYLGLEVEALAHDALGDVLVLELLFERLLSKMSVQKGTEVAALEEMIRISSQPRLFTTLRFGKHSGKKIEDLARTDPGYLEWLLAEKKKKPYGEEDWIYTIEHYLKAH
ncbi:MAG: Exonuclease RNase and polymerase [Parcubacteria group bacterium]|nr:Exonuclease RNase and polymerase [Parcubacteria group bacterium]